MTKARAVKMSELARVSGVPAATIKHYVREGLLPEPERTSRNMAYYDLGLVPRIKRIKDLQRSRFLPLKVIREVLDGGDAPTSDETVGAAIARVLASEPNQERRTRAELDRSGVPREHLAFLEQAGVVRATTVDGEEGFDGDDLEILRVLGAARAAGLDASMLPLEILAEYATAIRALVRAELRLFREGVVPRAGDDLSELTETATTLSERLVVLIRRKLLLPTLQDLVSPSPAEAEPKAPTTATTPPSRRRSRLQNG